MSDPLHFDGEVALITGAGRGLGRAHALELARRGARIVVNDLGGAVDGTTDGSSPADEVVAEIRAAGGTAVANLDSVSSAEGGAAMVAQALSEYGRLDTLINNAGILRDKSFGKITAAELDPLIDVHLRGAFNVTVPAWNAMKAAGHGRIISTTSGSGLFGHFGQANYGAVKAGLLGLTKVLAVEGRKAGITANVIAPAALTRMNDGLIDDIGKLLVPEAVSPVVAFLAHRSCEVTGHAFSVGGGHVAAILITETRGITETELSAESVRDRLPEIFDPAGAFVPTHLNAELRFLFGELEKAYA